MNIYVSNLPFQLTEEELKSIFAEYGDVSSVKIVMDRETNRSKGFGFVEMEEDDDAERAIENLNQAKVNGRELNVKKALPREERGSSNGGGGYSNQNKRYNKR